MYSIGQLAKIGKVSNRTLRYYEELGLIAPQSRGSNRYRYYDDSHVQRLGTIKMLQESGFSLKEIVGALSPMLDPQGNVTLSGQEMAKKIAAAIREQKKILVQRHNEIEKTIQELELTEKSLHDCFGCQLAKSFEDCARCTTGPEEISGASRDMESRKRERSLNGFKLEERGSRDPS